MQIAICPNCNINTAGNHAWNCPFNPNYNSSNTMIYNQPNNILTSPKNMNEEKKQKYPIKIREKVAFNFAHQHNAERVIVALSFAGYYVRCSVTSSGYAVYIYTDRDS